MNTSFTKDIAFSLVIGSLTTPAWFLNPIYVKRVQLTIAGTMKLYLIVQ